MSGDKIAAIAATGDEIIDDVFADIVDGDGKAVAFHVHGEVFAHNCHAYHAYVRRGGFFCFVFHGDILVG